MRTPFCLPRGLPDLPGWNRLCCGGFLYPTEAEREMELNDPARDLNDAQKLVRTQCGQLPRAGVRVTEIAVVANARPPRFAPRPPPPGFRLAFARRTASWELVRYVSTSPRLIGPNHARALRLDLRSGAATLVQLGGG